MSLDLCPDTRRARLLVTPTYNVPFRCNVDEKFRVHLRPWRLVLLGRAFEYCNLRGSRLCGAALRAAPRPGHTAEARRSRRALGLAISSAIQARPRSPRLP